jgi:ADP-ribose pyrophosphatase YjhB (NUDIX family)
MNKILNSAFLLNKNRNKFVLSILNKIETNSIIKSNFSEKLKFEFSINKFNDIHIKSNDLVKFTQSTNSDRVLFEKTLKESLDLWKNEKRTAVWIYLPIHLADLAAISSKFGFKYHHAENDEAVLTLWLKTDRDSKIPRYATHQMGVAGLVYRQDSNEILVIKDKYMIADFWKLPGGAADLGENIQDTAVREVFEETGIKTNFKSVLAFRQQHNYPSAHGRSDIYVICRLEPLTFDINACKDEIKMCQWINLDELCSYKENNLTKSLAKLIKYGVENGFENIDIKSHYMKSPFAGRFYNLFYRPIDSN